MEKLNFYKTYFSEGDFPSNDFQSSNRSQMYNFSTSQRLDLAFWSAAGCIRGQVLRLGWSREQSAVDRTWKREPSTVARIDLRSVHLRKCTFWKLLEVSTWQIAHLRSGHKFPLEKLHIWEVARSFHLTNCTFGKLSLGKIRLRGCRSGKCLWETI